MTTSWLCAGRRRGRRVGRPEAARLPYAPAVAIGERLLLGPGPSNPYPEAVAGLCRPLLGHLDPEFLEVLDETCERLRAVFRTRNRLTLPLSGTGSAGMEAALANLLGPGDVVVVGANGLFGERMCDIAGRVGATVVPVRAPWGRPLDPEAVLDAHPRPKVLAVVHAETSTGVRNDLGALAAGKGEALLLVDAVTSLGGIPFAVDEGGVDVAYSGSQKCLGAPPGLAPVTLGERARAALRPRPGTWYLDLGMIADYVASSSRRYHHTAPVSMVFSLHGALGRILEEGLDAIWARHEACGALLQEGLEAMGLELFAPAGCRLPQLTTVLVPDGVDARAVRSELLERYRIEIGAGVGEWAERVWRIGLMGDNARPEHVATLLGALGEVLRR
jgi:alanine-glyoxylate transaminase/serine-glyoxylate transaminase/serine-pyruvate transaminase